MKPVILTVILFACAGLVACGERQETQHTGAPAATQTKPVADERGDSEAPHDDMAALPLPYRLAFMTGHVEAGLALYRAGEPEMAAPHLLHPVSETHAAERVGLAALGFDASLFEAVSTALAEGRPAAEIEPQLTAAEANLAMVTAKAGGEPKEIITYLMKVLVEEYEVAVTNGVVTDPGEYQDAYGFAVVARGHAVRLGKNDGLLSEMDRLLGLWPEGAAIPPTDPTSPSDMKAQVNRVLSALAPA